MQLEEPVSRVLEENGEVGRVVLKEKTQQCMGETDRDLRIQKLACEVIDEASLEGKLKEAGHEWTKGEQVVEAEYPGSRVGHWNRGEGGDVIEVSQGSSPEPAGKPRSPLAEQIFLMWGGRSRAVDLGWQMGKEIKRWLGVETEKGLYMVCDGRRVQWRDLEETEEGKVVEVMVELRGGMGKK